MPAQNELNLDTLSRREFIAGTASALGLLALGLGTKPAQASVETANMAPIIYSGPSRKKIVSFTFDDGPWPVNTKKIMNIFESFGLEGEATFFQVGNNIKQHKNISEEVAGRGYDIGNHSMSHRYAPSIIASEIEPTQELIENLGVESKLFRSPGLTQGSVIQRKLATLGMVNVFTDYDIGDWTAPRISSKAITGRTVRSLHGGSIVLLHDGGDHENTVSAMPRILERTLKKGYQVVRLSKLLGYEK